MVMDNQTRSRAMNHLAGESSLYLQQHANNPVNWYPWGDEAFALAKQLDQPIFLSIGYSACHWCHVMEHESFEDAETARFLNEHFVSIKVDREERPDVDHLYMSALQAMTREGGGWPLSVWLTPEMQPFYAGTYYPPDDRYGMQRPSFKRLLTGIVDAWTTRRDEIRQQSGNVTEYLRQMMGGESKGDGNLSPSLIENAARAWMRNFDAANGGFGGAPKFPHAIELRLLLRASKRFNAGEFRHMVSHSLDKMAAGGMYDQIGGGFHRYSTDERWLVPHFEKMLYDNALLTSAYVDAWKATGEPEYRRIAEETIDYVLREMTSPPGAFYSTQDADSEGEEGKFYVWSKQEIDAILDKDQASLVRQVYGVTEGGNFEGHNILHRAGTWEQLAKLCAIAEANLRERIKAANAKLYEVRSKRVWPGRDEKILTSWNGLMIAAMAQAGAAFVNDRYLTAASAAADFILLKMSVGDSLFRTCAVESPPRIAGYLEDYACFIDALFEVYLATFERRWLEAAIRLASGMIGRFSAADGSFYSTSDEHAHLIARHKDHYDGSTPSGNAMAATALLRLGHLTARRDLIDAGARALGAFSKLLAESPGGSSQMLVALDFHLGPAQEIVVVGQAESAETRHVLSALRRAYLRNALLLVHDPDRGEAPVDLIPHYRDKTSSTDVRVYVCENMTCRAPLEGADAVEKWLSAER
jgi:uncharacterized protein